MLAFGVFVGADCGGNGGGGKDTGIDKAGGGASAEPKPEPVDFEPREFSGNGSSNIGTVKVPGDAVLEWTNQDNPAYRQILIYDDGVELNVSSDDTRGESVVPPGTYRNITVSGGDWTITIRPR